MNENQKESRMVAISLYRGNLHRVPEVPRRWPMPAPKISLKDFKCLLARRSKALSRLRASNPNPNNTLSNDSQLEPSPDAIVTGADAEGPSAVSQEDEDHKEPLLVAVTSAKKPLGESDSLVDAMIGEASEKKPLDGDDVSTEKQTEPVIGFFIFLLFFLNCLLRFALFCLRLSHVCDFG